MGVIISTWRSHVRFGDLVDLVAANVGRDAPDRVRVTVEQDVWRAAAGLELDDEEDEP